MADLAPQTGASEADAAGRKAFHRLIWFLLLLYVVAYLDRINIGFAALSMNRDLGLTAAAFGLANTVFYVGYLLFEIPSNLLMVRYGPRRWIARIMVTWGLASTLTMFAAGPTSLYALRLVVGIAEAGFVPGVLLYLTYWFPAARRGRATALFMVAQPLAIGLGSLASGLIMQGTHGAWGLRDWQWLFVLEGLPAVLLGLAVLALLPDRPADAPWLGASERKALEARIASEDPKRAAGGSWAELGTGAFLKLCLAYFCLVTSLNALATWSPLIVREALGGAPGGMGGGVGSLLRVGALTAIPGIVAALAMPFWGARSDRNGERILHYVVPTAVAILGWVCVASFAEPEVRVAGLVLCTAGGFSAMAILWTLAPVVLSARSRPLGTALLSCAGILGSVTSPMVVGLLRDATGSFASGAWYAAALLLVSAATIALLAGAASQPRATKPLIAPGTG